jgi:hypothetical protein
MSPASTGCASTAITAEYANIFNATAVRIGQIQLRYSTACRTVWGRIIEFAQDPGQASVHRNSDGRTYACNNPTWSSSLGAYSCYTAMVYDAQVTSSAGGIIEENQTFFTARTSSY